MGESNGLGQLSDEELARRIRDLMAEMGPLEEALGRLRVEVQRLASEQRRRERQSHLRARIQVRTTLQQGEMPTLQQAAESVDELLPGPAPLRDLRFFRDSGTEVGLGYATGREPTIWMTNGGETVAVRSMAEVRSRYLEGWDFGTSAHPGVRIHILNSRTEKVVPASEVFLRAGEG
jgi:hypothetical protein